MVTVISNGEVIFPTKSTYVARILNFVLLKNLQSLNPFLFRYRHLLLGGLGFVIISNVFTLYPAQIFRLTLDLLESLLYLNRIEENWLGSTTLPQIISMTALLSGVLVLLAALLRGLFLFFTRQTLINMSRHIEYEQKNQLYHHYQQMSRSFFRKYSTGDMMSRISEDVGKVRMYTGPGIMYTINTITLFIMVITTMLMVNVELTLYSIIPLPILCYAIYKVESVVTQKSKHIQEKIADLTAFTQESYSGIRSIKSFVREESLTDLFTKESNSLKEKAMELVKVNALFFPSIIFLIGLSTLITVWIGSEQVIKGTLTTGNIAEFVIYVNLLTWPVASLGWVSTMIQQAGASQARILEFLEQNSELKFPEPATGLTLPPNFHVKLDRVSVRYPETGILALKDISFEIPPGKTIALLGKTGSGKSTIASLILRLMDPDEGEILLDAKPLKQYEKTALRNAIGYVPQDVLLFSETIGENIAFGKPGATSEEIKAAADFAAVLSNILDFPDGFNTIVGEKGVTLSGGQKQRVSLARAIIKKPSLLILDDSLSAVDTKTEDEIHSNILALQQQPNPPSVLLISHRISTVRHADKIIVLSNGKISESGTHAELLEMKGDYWNVNNMQSIEQEVW
jgi:ATP-binding cassette subfamily B protein